MSDHTVMGVQEGAEHAPLLGPCVEDHRDRDVVVYHQEVHIPIAQGAVQTKSPMINNELGG
jgi:hypothetical protein